MIKLIFLWWRLSTKATLGTELMVISTKLLKLYTFRFVISEPMWVVTSSRYWHRFIGSVWLYSLLLANIAFRRRVGLLTVDRANNCAARREKRTFSTTVSILFSNHLWFRQKTHAVIARRWRIRSNEFFRNTKKNNLQSTSQNDYPCSSLFTDSALSLYWSPLMHFPVEVCSLAMVTNSNIFAVAS
jgi:hypothetical protein